GRRPGSKGNEWLLIKKHDDQVVEGYDAGEIRASVLSTRSMADIRGGARARAWSSSRPAGRGKLKAPWLADAVAKLDQKRAAAKGQKKKSVTPLSPQATPRKKTPRKVKGKR